MPPEDSWCACCTIKMHYLASYGLGRRLGVFSLFSMSKGYMEGKGWQLAAAVALTAGALAVMKRRKQI